MSRTAEDLAVELSRRFASLRTPDDDRFEISPLPQSTNGSQIYLAVGADAPRLLLPLHPAVSNGFAEDRKSAGVQIVRNTLEINGDERDFADIKCLKSDLRWLFCTFLADVLVRIEADGSLDGVEVAKLCLQAWRALFAHGGRQLSMQQLAGLYGELVMAERLLRRYGSEVLSTWRGPLGGSHDFEGSGCDFEVKTTISTDDTVVHIHGLEQLSEREEIPLVLAHFRVEVPAADGESVPEMVDRLISDHPVDQLPNLLMAVGYFADHREAYAEAQFALVSETWYRVRDEFPRLSPSTFAGGLVPIALSNFAYRLDLAQVLDVPIGEAERHEYLEVYGG